MLAVILFFWINTLGYSNVLEPELALVGLLSTDTLHHTAISSMFTQHGVVSTGLDGLVRTPYHALSHLWIGRTSQWLNTTPIHGYYLVVQAIAIPLLFFGLAASTAIHGDGNDEYAFRFPDFVMVPLSLMFVIAIWDFNSFLISESHTTGLLLFMIALPLLLEQAREHLGHGAIFRLTVICVLGILMLLTKVSVGALWFAGLGYILVRHTIILHLSMRQVLGLAVALVVAFAILLPSALSILPPDQVDVLKFAPFSFAFEFAKSWQVAVINTIAIAIGGLVIRDRIVQTGRNIPAELIGVLMATAWLITMTIYLAGASGYYFLNVGTWLAIVVTARWLLRRVGVHDSKSRRSIWVGAIASAIALNPQIAQGYSIMRGMVVQLAQLSNAPEPPFIFATVAIARQLDGTAGAQLIKTISSHISYGEKDALIFVPPSNFDYWNLNEFCYSKAFVIPALTGIPLINGLPPSYTKCPRQIHFSYAEYTAKSASTEMGHPELCAKARRLGYRRVGILSAPGAFQLLNCN